MHDSRYVPDGPANSHVFERVFPICASRADAETLQELVPLAETMLQIFYSAPQRGTWPACLRCCCCREKKRTSCCFRYTILFGQIKQLGVILKS